MVLLISSGTGGGINVKLPNGQTRHNRLAKALIGTVCVEVIYRAAVGKKAEDLDLNLEITLKSTQLSGPLGFHLVNLCAAGRPKEANHDASLYRLYHKAAGEIERNGGKVLRVQLDYELKEKLYPHRFLAAEEVRRLIAASNEPLGAIIVLATMTGLRIGEILALRWGRIDLLRGTLLVAETCYKGHFGSPKTRASRREVPLAPVVVRELKDHYSCSVEHSLTALVFARSQGVPLAADNLRK
jgi:integrase